MSRLAACLVVTVAACASGADPVPQTVIESMEIENPCPRREMQGSEACWVALGLVYEREIAALAVRLCKAQGYDNNAGFERRVYEGPEGRGAVITKLTCVRARR